MKKFSRHDFFKVAGGAVIGASTYGLTDNISHSFAQSPVIASTKINDNNYIGSKAKVYFSSQINTDSLLKLYNLINEGIYGKTAIKNFIQAKKMVQIFCLEIWFAFFNYMFPIAI